MNIIEYSYKTCGSCAKEIIVDLDGDRIKSVQFIGGCNGNTKGMSTMSAGQNIDDVIARCKGILCGVKGTSCPDQLAHALEYAKEQQKIDT